MNSSGVAEAEPQGETLWNRPAGLREVLILSGPLVISTMSWTIMQFIDRAMLIRYSPASVAAALPAGALFFWFICLPLGVTQYVNTFVAQYHGAGRPERIGVSVWQGVWVGLVTMPLMMALTPFVGRLFATLGHDPQVADLELIYFRVNTWGAGAYVISGALGSFFTGRGRVMIVAGVDTLAAAINVLLDYLWIYGYAGFPEMGIAGAAWATVVAVWIKTVLLGVLFLWPSNDRLYHIRAGCRLDRELLKRLLRFGVPSGVQWVIEVGGFTIFLLLVGRLQTFELTATNLAFNVNALAFMPVWGIGIAATTVVGQCMGRNRPDLAVRGTWSAFIIAVVYVTAVSALYVLAPQWVLYAYWSVDESTEVTQLRDLTIVLLRFVAAYTIFDAANMIFSSAVKGAGDTRFVMLANLVLLPVPMVLTWLALERWEFGLYGAWIVLTAWIMMLGGVFLVRFLSGRWRAMHVIDDLPPDDDPPDVD